jgi:hypothetical protein
MKAMPGEMERGALRRPMPRTRLDSRFHPDRAEHPGAYYPGAPVWEPGEGLDAFFPDSAADVETDDDEG